MIHLPNLGINFHFLQKQQRLNPAISSREKFSKTTKDQIYKKFFFCYTTFFFFTVHGYHCMSARGLKFYVTL